MILGGLLVGVVLVGLSWLVALGVRAGDRPGDAVLLDVAVRSSPCGARVTLSNPGEAPIICGISLRRAGGRLRLEGGSYVRIRTGRTDAELLAGRQAQLGALRAGETRTFVLAASEQIDRRAELVVVIGQSERLRTIHRLLALPPQDFSARAIGWAGGGPAAGPPRHAARAPRPVSE